MAITLHSVLSLSATWIQAWDELPQYNIQQWIEHLVCHIQEVIELEGGNEYKKGTTGFDTWAWKGKRRKGVPSKCQDLGDGPLF